MELRSCCLQGQLGVLQLGWHNPFRVGVAGGMLLVRASCQLPVT
jgi:hypothetical protein